VERRHERSCGGYWGNVREIGSVPASSAQSKWLVFGCFWSKMVAFGCFGVKPGVIGDILRDMVVLGGVV
jgi:hypothetical protein